VRPKNRSNVRRRACRRSRGSGRRWPPRNHPSACGGGGGGGGDRIIARKHDCGRSRGPAPAATEDRQRAHRPRAPAEPASASAPVVEEAPSA